MVSQGETYLSQIYKSEKERTYLSIKNKIKTTGGGGGALRSRSSLYLFAGRNC